jgi:hypothetical protein
VLAAPDEVVAAPDYAEAIEAWRVWFVIEEDEGVRLRSVVMGTIWEPGVPLSARCLKTSNRLIQRLRRDADHLAPGVRCECGIYGTQLENLEPYLRDERFGAHTLGRAFGKVSLWGQVIECERGWRGASAYPSRIYVPVRGRANVDAAEIALELAVYRVPVELVPQSPFRALGAVTRA